MARQSMSKAAIATRDQQAELALISKTLTFIRGQYTAEQKALPKIIALVAEYEARQIVLAAALAERRATLLTKGD